MIASSRTANISGNSDTTNPQRAAPANRTAPCFDPTW